MKDLQGTFIFAICLLAFTAVVFFFKYGQQRAQSRVLEAENLAAQNMALNIEKKAAEADRASRIARARAEENLKKAKEAREMLEKAKSQSALTQQQIVERLNAQLEREAEARISAQKASEELVVQRDLLSQSVAETKRALELLRAQRKSENAAEISRMRKLLKEREDEIAALRIKAAALEKLCRQAEEAQMRTEAEIESRGGVVTLSRNKRILPPSLRSSR